jgi:hypothetical protein
MKQNEIALILFSILILVAIWIGSNVYHAHIESDSSGVQGIQVMTIDPKFEKEVIGRLKNRTKIDPLFQSSSAASPIRITPTASPLQDDSESASGSALDEEE